MTPTEAAALLDAGLHLRASSITRATRGHTNDSFFLSIGQDRFVLRISWPDKPLERALEEEQALRRLQDASVITPRVIARARVEDRTLHLFERIEGDVLPEWNDDPRLVEEALGVLDALHHALSTPPSPSRPTEWLRHRLARIEALPPQRLPDELAAGLSRALRLVTHILDDADARYAGTSQLVHGDFHLGNLLRTPQGLAVLDFDDVGRGSARLERALAHAALTRIDDDDDLRFHAQTPEPHVFAASQVLVHVEAAQRGRWTLERGIGFWSCWRAIHNVKTS